MNLRLIISVFAVWITVACSKHSPTTQTPQTKPTGSWAMALSGNCFFRLDFSTSGSYEVFNDCLSAEDKSTKQPVNLSDVSLNSTVVIYREAWMGSYHVINAASGNVIVFDPPSASSCQADFDALKDHPTASEFSIENNSLTLKSAGFTTSLTSSVADSVDASEGGAYPVVFASPNGNLIVNNGCLTAPGPQRTFTPKKNQ